MATEWQKDRAGFKPYEFEKCNKKQWIQRENIKEIEVKDDPESSETRIEYESDMRFISNEEYEALMSKRLQETNHNSSVSTANELDLMDAIVDLYEMIISV